MFEVRFHGRGGQGTVVASVLLAHAAFREGRGVQAFPYFGVERRGAPVVAHARVAEGPVRLACEVRSPDAVVVMDPSLVAGLGERVVDGLRPGGVVLVSTRRRAAEVAIPGADRGDVAARIAVVDAAAIARRHGLGSAASPIVNTAVLGALARVTGVVAIDALDAAVRDKVPTRADANRAALADGYAGVVAA